MSAPFNDSNWGFPHLFQDIIPEVFDQIGSLSSSVTTNTNNIVNKADKTYTDNQLALKRDKSVTIKGADIDISTDANKIGLTQLQDAVKQSIAGTAPINASVDGKAVTEEKYAPNSIRPYHTNFISVGKNLFNKDTATMGYFIDYTTGLTSANASYNCSDFIPVTPNGTYSYQMIRNQHFAFYDKNKSYISNAINSLPNPFTAPGTAYYVRVSILSTDDLTKTQIELGTVTSTPQPFMYNLNSYIDTSKNLPLKSITTSLASDFIARYVSGKNKFNKYTIIQDGYIDYTTGFVLSNNLFWRSDWLPVNPNTQYIQSHSTFMAIYDQNKVYISGDNNVNAGFTTPSNAAYVRVSYSISGLDYNQYQLEVGTVSSSYEPFILIYPASIGPTPVQSLAAVSKWNNKIVSTFGDSITQQAKWQPYVTQKFSLTLNNYGVGGTRISDGTGTDTTAMCRDERINAIASNSDIITIMGGTNDWAQNVSLGTLNRSNVDTTTFYGACNVMFKKLTTAFPNARILCMSTPFGIMPNRSGWTDTSGLLNNQNLLSIDYGQALMSIARLWGVPIIDVGGQAGWNETNIATYVTNDGNYLHPNDAGGQRLAGLVIGKLQSIEPVV